MLLMMDDEMIFASCIYGVIYGVEGASIHDIDHDGVREGLPCGVVIHSANMASSHD